MARFSVIFNLSTVIFVLCGSFVIGRETTVEERKTALSTLFKDLDMLVTGDNNKVQTKFDECCDRYDPLEQTQLLDCVNQYFTTCAKGLQANVNHFIGTGAGKDLNREYLMDFLTTYEKALNDPAKDITTPADLALLIPEIKEWKRTMNDDQIVFFKPEPNPSPH